jgi:tRNA uridine 5-carboxymethylaminomethyl modification enzyme
MEFDIIVIGGGHAGIEACISATKIGCKVLLATMDKRTIGRLSCNPSIGGSAKGHLAKEIDALGGLMPFIADRSGLQFKMLNISKGPAIWSPRSQNDKDLYPAYAQEFLSHRKNLTILPINVSEIVIEKDKVVGIKSNTDELIKCKAVILCGGTFLNGKMFTGFTATEGGRVGEQSAHKISDLLNSYGIKKGRLKTGTPPRIHIDSIDFTKTEIETGDANPIPFSKHSFSVRNKLVCYSTKTSDTTHDILRTGFDKSPMFTGLIKGSGPRYCPSIEDKIFRFSDKSSHQILLEPESLLSDSIYVNGFSTSLPKDIQETGLRSIEGLENCKILKYGYAVEYDFFYPYQLKYTLETKAISGLFFAGQINGTSGYEEAAGQGLVAGVNAANKILGYNEFKLERSDAYIGVMIDDLINKSSDEPYRIFTSLAEYRLLLRQDNAGQRLAKIAYENKLISEEELAKQELHQKRHNELYSLTNSSVITKEVINNYLLEIEESPVQFNTRLDTIVKRPPVVFKNLLSRLTKSNESNFERFTLLQEVVNSVEIDIKYSGYIERQLKEIAYFKENESKQIPLNFDYSKVTSLSTEAREKLKMIQPASLGQASRIPGVSSSDVSILAIYLK